jgi:hypothetical protein
VPGPEPVGAACIACRRSTGSWCGGATFYLVTHGMVPSAATAAEARDLATALCLAGAGLCQAGVGYCQAGVGYCQAGVGYCLAWTAWARAGLCRARAWAGWSR